MRSSKPSREPAADDSSWQTSDDGDSGGGDMFGTDDDQFA